MKISVILICLGVYGGTAFASNVFVDQVQSWIPGEEELEASAERLEKRWPILDQQETVVPPFHQRVGLTEAYKGTLCGNCHTTAPHRQDQARRAFLNSHAQHLDCMVCHWKPETEDDLHRMSHRWVAWPSLDGVDIQQHDVPGGTRLIALFDDQPLVVLDTEKLAKDIEQQWQVENQRVELHARIHGPLDTEGPHCSDCHQSKESLLDFSQLGYKEKRLQSLVQHPIPRFIDRLSSDQQSRIQLTDLLRR